MLHAPLDSHCSTRWHTRFCCGPCSRQALHEREQRAAPERLEALGELLGSAQQRERELQERYKALTRRREELTAALAQQQPAA